MPAVVDGCPDLDENEISDCRETLVENAFFKFDTDLWVPDSGAELARVEDNAYPDPQTGVAELAHVIKSDTGGLGSMGMGQCVELGESSELQVALNVFIPPDQGEGLASMVILFYDVAGCMGQVKSRFNRDYFATNTWGTVSGTHALESGIRSMLVRLVVTKPFVKDRFVARFDNVFVRPND